MKFSKYSELCLVGAALAVLPVSFLYFRTTGWPGLVHECVALANCYCEAPRAGLIAQPANTWSCLTWAVAGLWIAWNESRRRQRAASQNPEPGSYGSSFYTGTYALVVTGLVLGGMFFHASLTDWGGKLDILSLYLLVNFWIFFNLAKSLCWTRTRFLVGYLTTTAVLLIPRAIYSAIDVGLMIFLFLLAVGLVTEIRIGQRPDRRWVWVGLGSFVIAHLVQAAMPCHPQSLLQPHAVLHIIEIAPLVAFYFHFFGEIQSAIAATPRTDECNPTRSGTLSS